MANLLEEKTDEMIASTEAKDIAAEQKAVDLFEQTPDTPDQIDTTEETVQAIEAGMERAASIEEPEGVQVASLKDVVTGVVEGVVKKTQQAQKRTGQALPDEPVQEVAGRVVIKEATPDDVTAINEALGGQYTKGLNFPQIAAQMGDFDLADYYARVRDANEELFEKARRGTLGFDAILEGAENQGIDNIVIEMLRRRPGTPATAEEVLGGIIGSYHLMKETDAAFTAARALPAGAEREEAMRRAMQLMSAEGVLLANVSGAVSEAGRTLQAAGVVGKKLDVGDLAGRAERINRLFAAENVDDFEHIAEFYMALKEPHAKAHFIKQGFIAKSMDVIAEVWINSILSSPATHAVNVAGNASFMMLRTAETAIAAGIGRIRSGITGNKNRVRAREALAQLEGMRRGLRDATLLMGRVMATETPGDIGSKIDVRNTRAIGTTGDIREIGQMIRDGNMAAGALNVYGVAMRLPGRFLLAEDEFFKALGYRMALHQEAIIESGNLFDEMIAAGKSMDEAKIEAAKLEASILENPPSDIIKTAKDAARQMTFQEDLGGVMGGLQGLASHPIAKLFVPFFKTPTNIMAQVAQRSSIAALFLSPTIRRQLRAGGREFDMAMAKITSGSAIMGGFAYMSMGIDDPDDDVIIVGKGPSDREARQAMMRKGIQPYSINKKIYNEDGTWTGKYKSVTFSRFDPISGLLAMSADFAYYAQYEDDQATLDMLAMHAAAAAANYAVEMPFLQGVQELTAIFRNPDKLMESGTELFATKVTEAVSAMALYQTSSMIAGIERTGELGEGAAGPAVASTMMPEKGLFGEDVTELPPFMRGFYKALQKAKGRNPFFSDTVEPRLNLWGEVMTTGTGSGWEMINPIRINETKFSPVDDELMRLGDGISMPNKKISGILLNAKQYNQFIRYISKTDANGITEGEEGYDYSTTLLPQLQKLIMRKDYRALPTKEDQFDKISFIVEKFKTRARNLLLTGDADLKRKIIAVQ
jgi:hypothetical protein